ncbi:437_t:CDS:1 [Acaulospora colombiana]|uniref:437_t:CDS:1 n=1 Tax=Acaulospora colombiana TaxID=27376 RepID=A0ACA9MJR3_9GLOM|nr:437_t:CDS:1 [Acaulospora colombiana]
MAESKFVASDWSLQEYLLWMKLLDTVEKFYGIALVRQEHKSELVQFLKKQGKSESAKLFDYYIENQSEKIINKLYQELLESLKADTDYYNTCREFIYNESTSMDLKEGKEISQETLNTLKTAFEKHYQLFEAIDKDPTVWARINNTDNIEK